jgi:CheY-like chemotaxis protein
MQGAFELYWRNSAVASFGTKRPASPFESDCLSVRLLVNERARRKLLKASSQRNRARVCAFFSAFLSVKPITGRMDKTMTESTKSRVLVADDEQVIANSLTMILNQAGFDAIAVYSGEQAVEMAETFQPDLLVSDVVMGEMTGIEAAIQIRKKFPECKVLLFSGQAATTGLLQKAKAEGYDFELLLKPVHPADLLAKLQQREIQTNV